MIFAWIMAAVAVIASLNWLVVVAVDERQRSMKRRIEAVAKLIERSYKIGNDIAVTAIVIILFICVVIAW